MSASDGRFELLWDQLLDRTVDGPWSSGFGPTGYDPGTDFPVCRRAVESLVEMGSNVVPRLLAHLQGATDEHTYFVAEVVARLGVREAIPALEQLVRNGTEVSRRVNYDQYIEYRVYEKALAALMLLDPELAKSILREVAADRQWHSAWARQTLDEIKRNKGPCTDIVPQ